MIRWIFCQLFLIATSVTLGQTFTQTDTLLFDSNWYKTQDERDAAYLQIVKYEDGQIFMTNYYMPSRKLYNHGEVYQIRPFKHQGLVHWYHENGQLKEQARFINGVSVGLEKHFDEKGQPTFEYFHKDNKTYTVQVWDKFNKPLLKGGNGTIVTGQGTNLLNHTTYKDSICVESFHIRQNQQDTIYTVCDSYVSYKGGMEKLYEKIENRTHYSLNAFRRGHRGTVYVESIIDKGGIASEIKILDKVYYEFDLEAIRVIESLKKWIPGKHQGKPVKCLIVLPVKFE